LDNLRHLFRGDHGLDAAVEIIEGQPIRLNGPWCALSLHGPFELLFGH
jgi:hypothetical protein